MRYRRVKTPGGTYFFTVVTFRRRKILCDPDNLELLRTAFKLVKTRNPFTIDALVLLPEHLHCIWTLPAGDDDYSMRWNAIKGHFSRHCSGAYKIAPSAARRTGLSKPLRLHSLESGETWLGDVCPGLASFKLPSLCALGLVYARLDG